MDKNQKSTPAFIKGQCWDNQSAMMQLYIGYRPPELRRVHHRGRICGTAAYDTASVSVPYRIHLSNVQAAPAARTDFIMAEQGSVTGRQIPMPYFRRQKRLSKNAGCHTKTSLYAIERSSKKAAGVGESFSVVPVHIFDPPQVAAFADISSASCPRRLFVKARL